MRSNINGRSSHRSDCEANAEEKISFMVDEEDPPCAEYVIMSEQCNMPALQEYLHDLHAGRLETYSW